MPCISAHIPSTSISFLTLSRESNELLFQQLLPKQAAGPPPPPPPPPRSDSHVHTDKPPTQPGTSSEGPLPATKPSTLETKADAFKTAAHDRQATRMANTDGNSTQTNDAAARSANRATFDQFDPLLQVRFLALFRSAFMAQTKLLIIVVQSFRQPQSKGKNAKRKASRDLSQTQQPANKKPNTKPTNVASRGNTKPAKTKSVLFTFLLVDGTDKVHAGTYRKPDASK